LFRWSEKIALERVATIGQIQAASLYADEELFEWILAQLKKPVVFP